MPHRGPLVYDESDPGNQDGNPGEHARPRRAEESTLKLAALFLAVTGMAGTGAAQAPGEAPAPDQGRPSGPLSRVTLEVRTTKAINYRHLSGPTRIDFRGTVLLSQAQGQARIESRRGAIHIQAQFEKLDPASRFGPAFLTYVLWAISPKAAPTIWASCCSTGRRPRWTSPSRCRLSRSS